MCVCVGIVVGDVQFLFGDVEERADEEDEPKFEGIQDLIESFWRSDASQVSLVNGVRSVFLPRETTEQVYDANANANIYAMMDVIF